MKYDAIFIKQSLISTLFSNIRPGIRIQTECNSFIIDFYLRLRGSKLNIKYRGCCHKLPLMREVKTFGEGKSP